MDLGVASRTFFLLLLIMLFVSQYVHGSGAREMSEKQQGMLTDHNHINKQYDDRNHDGTTAMKHSMIDGINKGANVLRLHSMDVETKVDHHVLHDMQKHIVDDYDHQRMVHMDHVHGHPSSQMDPSLIVFFIMGDLKVGKTMSIYFPRRDPSLSPPLFPREKADTIPFSLQQVPNLLQRFSFSKGSPQAIAMEDTLRQCEIKPIKGETKLCATSLESMLDFARGVFGLDTHIRVLTTTHLTKSTTLLQNYTILEVPQEIFTPKMVACHTMPYPYAVFYCHSQDTRSRVFKVSLAGENGDRVEAISVCHMDTSQWSPHHASFGLLGIEPGTSPVCHFFPADNFVWASSPTSA